MKAAESSMWNKEDRSNRTDRRAALTLTVIQLNIVGGHCQDAWRWHGRVMVSDVTVHVLR